MQVLEAYRRETQWAESSDVPLLSWDPNVKGKFKELSLMIQLSLTLQSLYSPGEGCRVSKNLQAVGTCRWQGCQPYTPVAFTHQEIALVLISVKSRNGPQGYIAATVTPLGIETVTFRL